MWVTDSATHLGQATIFAPEMAPLLNWGVVIAASCYATVIDVRCRRIPNRLTFPLLLSGVIWALLSGGIPSLGDALLGMLIAGVPFITLWMIGGGGAGDAKMMLAIGAWLGPSNAFIATLAVAIAGGLLCVTYARAHRRLSGALANTGWMFLTLPFVLAGPGALSERKKLVPASSDVPLKTPYSVAILSGACAAAAWILICTR